MQQYIDSILAEIERWFGEEARAVWAHTFGLLDPFWGYLLEGLLVIAVCFAAGWFFNVLRPVAGAVVMAAIAFLVGFWKGENAEKKRK